MAWCGMWRVGHVDVEMRESNRRVRTRVTTPPAASSPARRVEQREKQVAMGKKTREYKLCCVHAGTERPVTPDARGPASKRAFDTSVRLWRRALHGWDDTGVTPFVGHATASKWSLPSAAALRNSVYWSDD